MLQQHLPFTVLKPSDIRSAPPRNFFCGVATTPTVYGIETMYLRLERIHDRIRLQQHLPFTVLKPFFKFFNFPLFMVVATTPTVYGIETACPSD